MLSCSRHGSFELGCLDLMDAIHAHQRYPLIKRRLCAFRLLYPCMKMRSLLLRLWRRLVEGRHGSKDERFAHDAGFPR